MNTIQRNQVLKEMEIKTTPIGQVVTFSISFYKQNGEIVYLPKAKSCGLRTDMTKNRMRGVQAIDFQGNNIGHIYPVSIDNIRTFNNEKVVL